MNPEISININLEESLLGSLLLTPDLISQVDSFLPIEAFALTVHQFIYEAILTLNGQKKVIDILTVSSWLEDRKMLSKIGGKRKLEHLISQKVSDNKAEQYAELVFTKYKRRQLIEVGKIITERAADTSLDIEDVENESKEMLFRATEYQSLQINEKSMSECNAIVYKQMIDQPTAVITTGLKALDDLISGFYPDDVVIISGRPSMGKTWFSIYLTNHFAQTYQKPIVFFSLEMGLTKITKRFWSYFSGIDSKRLLDGKIYKTEMDSLKEAIIQLNNLPIIIDATPRQSPQNIQAALRRIQYKHGEIGMIVLDHLQEIVLKNSQSQTRAAELGEISSLIKKMARDFHCPFVTLAQLNRNIEYQNNKRPIMSSIRDSGVIEEKADVILSLYRDEYYNPQTKDKGIVEIIANKCRDGDTGIRKASFDKTTGRFSDIKVNPTA